MDASNLRALATVVKRGFKRDRQVIHSPINPIRGPALALGLFASLSAIGSSSDLAVGNATATVTGNTSQTLNFPVTATGDSSYDRYLSYSTGNVSDTAVAGTDYTATTGVLMIPAGASSGNVPVTIAGSNATGPQTSKTFSLNLPGAVGTGPAPSFATAQTLATGFTTPYSTCTPDLNGDGRPDLVSFQGNGTGISLRLNTTTPGSTAASFGAEVLLAASSLIVSTPCQVADLDGDGRADIVYQMGNFVRVLLNRVSPGANSVSAVDFSDANIFAIPNLAGFTVADLNGDGRPDLIVSNSSVGVWLNLTPAGGALEFSTPQFYALENGTYRYPAVADLNGDGRPDLVVNNSISNTVSVLLNQMAPGVSSLSTNSFSQQQSYPVGNAPYTLLLEDVDGDGRRDLLLRTASDVRVLINQITAGASSLNASSFGAAVTYETAVDNFSIQVAFCDLNGDGKPEPIVIDKDGRSLQVLPNRTLPGGTLGAASFGAPLSFDPLGEVNRVTTADFNLDGKPDLLTTNFNSNTLSVLMNTTPMGVVTPGFAPQPAVTGMGQTSTAAAADFNGDGRLDVAVVDKASGNTGVNVLLNTTAAGATALSTAAPVRTALLLSNVPQEPTVTDFNGDGRPDLLLASETAGRPLAVLINSGTVGATDSSGAQFTTTLVGGALHAQQAEVADLNGDGRPDVVVRGYDHQLTLLRNTSDGSPTPSVASAGTTNTVCTGSVNDLCGSTDIHRLADFDGDGRPDIATLVYVGSGGDKLTVLRNTTPLGATGNFSFTPAFAAPQDVGNSAVEMRLTDFDGDGRTDIAVLQQNTPNGVLLLRNTTPAGGSISFAPAVLIGTSFGVVKSLQVADFNGDGRPDLLVGTDSANSTSNNQNAQVLLNTSTPGSISASSLGTQVLPPSSGVAGLVLGDFDLDGRTDFGVSYSNLSGSGTYGFAGYLNTQFRVTTTPATAIGTIAYNLPVPLSASPNPLNFGTQATGVNSAALTLTINDINGTAGTFTITTGTNPMDFAATNSTCASISNHTCTVDVRFNPGANGARSATLHYSNNTGGTLDIPLSGTGAALDLGTVNTGSSNTQIYTISNSSGSAVSLMLFTATGGFTISNNTCGMMLAGGGSCQVTVQYAPTQGGKDSGTLSYSRDGNPQAVALSGTAVGPITAACNADATEAAKNLIRAVDRANSDLAHLQTISLATSCLYSFTKTNQTNDADGSRFSGEGDNALPVILGKLSIEGNGAIIERSSSATGKFRLIYTAVGTSLALNQLTLRGGQATDAASEQPGRHGGAIYASDLLTIRNSTLTGNKAGSGGMGTTQTSFSLDSNFQPVYTYSGTTGARGGEGGAIYSARVATISNSTLSGNTTGQGGFGGPPNGGLGNGGTGGAISSRGVLTIINSTLLDNRLYGFPQGYDDATAIETNGIAPELHNNIISGAIPVCSDLNGVGDHNFMTDSSCGTGSLLIGGYAIASSALKLGTLANNGGPTQTIALLAGSVAIDKGDAATCADSSTINNLDQRGITRPQGSVCDVGAFEYVNGVSVNPTSLSFGSQAVNTSATSKTVTITDASRQNVQISVTGTNGTPNTDFSGASCVTVTSTICTISVGFTPSAAGSRTATLRYQSDGGYVDVPLTGSGVAAAPAISATPDPLDFGSIGGLSTTSQSLTMTNTGNVPVYVRLPEISGGGSRFSNEIGSGSCIVNTLLQPGANCTFLLKFQSAPGVAETFTATVTLKGTTSDLIDATATATLSAKSTAALVSMTPAMNDFGSVTVDNSSNKVLYTLSNTGNAPLTITSILSNSSEFAISDSNCGSILNAANECTFMVRFVPATAGTRTAVISLLSNADNGTNISVDVVGEAVAFRTLSLATNGGTGSGMLLCNGSTCAPGYPDGTSISITATPAANADFSSFSGDCSGASCILTMTANKSVTATFTLKGRALNLATNGATGSGTLMCNGVACASSYPDGTAVAITATPAANSAFTSFSGCDSISESTCNVMMNASRSVTATFTLKQRTLSLTFTGTGTGTLLCNGTTCAPTYADGTALWISAIPTPNSTFSAFDGCDSVSGGTCSLTMTADKTVVTTFALKSRVLTLTSAGSGSGTLKCNGGACAGSYADGTVLAITATPAANSDFGSFTGCDSVSGGTCNLTMTGDKTVVTTFALKNRVLTLTNAGPGSGTLKCNGGACAGSYADGTVLAITATPAANSDFGSFTGCDSVSGGTCNLTMTGDKTVVTTFALKGRTLSVTNGGTGSGTVLCNGGPCASSYTDGTVLSITAAPASNSTLGSFTGCDSVTGGTCNVTMTTSKAVVAIFVLKNRTLTLTSAGTGSGTLKCNGGSCSTSYPDGTVLAITATAASSSEFGNFSGCDSVSSNTCNVIMSADKAIITTFTLRQLHLSISIGGSGGVSGGGINCSTGNAGICGADYAYGSPVTLTAAPAALYTFAGWSGDCIGTGACTVTLNTAKNVTANFAPVPQISVGTPTPSPDFGNQQVNSTSEPVLVTVNSSGTAPVTLTSIGVSGDFVQTNNCPIAPATLAVGSSCTISLTFEPAILGARTGSLVVVSNGGSSTQTLTGSGTNSIPASFSFSPVTDAAPGSTQTSNEITVNGTNISSSITIVGGQYSVNGGSYTSAAGMVPPGAKVTVQVQASSNYGGTVNATLDIGGVSASFSVETQSTGQSVTIKRGGGAFSPWMILVLGLAAMCRRYRFRMTMKVLMPLLFVSFSGMAKADDSILCYFGMAGGDGWGTESTTSITHSLQAQGYQVAASDVGRRKPNMLFYAGFKIIDALDVEAGYMIANQKDIRIQGATPAQLGPFLNTAAKATRGLDQALLLTLVYKVDIAPNWTFEPRIGPMYWMRNIDIAAGNQSFSASDAGIGVHLGSSLQYRLWRELSIGPSVDYYRFSANDNLLIAAARIQWGFGGF